jgi:hypothetical protein
MAPTRLPAAFLVHSTSGAYVPVLYDAYEWAPASMARQSWPVATETGEMAFMIP